MVDMEIAEAYSNNQPGGRTQEAKIELGRRVLAAHDVTPEELDTTLAWYGRNLDEYSALFEKIDKEILKRKRKYIEPDVLMTNDANNLWPYSRHLVLSPLSGYDALVFSLPEPPVDRGERLKFSFTLPNIKGMRGLLGVEYEDGTSESSSSVFNSKSKIEMELQTDTGKTVSRLYGVMTLKEKADHPVFIDSLLIAKIPFDSLEYRQKKRTQKSYGAFRPHPVPVAKKDTIFSDTTVNQVSVDTLSHLKLRPRPPQY